MVVPSYLDNQAVAEMDDPAVKRDLIPGQSSRVAPAPLVVMMKNGVAQVGC
jgi:hypothetical protein